MAEDVELDHRLISIQSGGEVVDEIDEELSRFHVRSLPWHSILWSTQRPNLAVTYLDNSSDHVGKTGALDGKTVKTVDS